MKSRQQGHRRATCSWPISSVSPASPPRDGCPYRSAQLPGTAQREVNHVTSHARALPNSVEGEFTQCRSTNQSGLWRARGGVEDAVRTVHCGAGQYLSPKIACAPGWAALTAGLQVPCAPAPTAHPHNPRDAEHGLCTAGEHAGAQGTTVQIHAVAEQTVRGADGARHALLPGK